MTRQFSIYFIPVLTSQILLSPFAWGLPQGADVAHGQVLIDEVGSRMIIQQASDRAIVNYQDFSIGAGEAVHISQPSAESILLNRVTGNHLSEIHGQLNANGQVFLINPAGILVGEGAQINVGGLLLTTHEMSDHDFLSNQFQFNAAHKPSVVQIDGQIQVDPGSFVIVLAQNIDLGGDIIAQFGTVAMVASDGASVLLQQGQWPQIQVKQATYDAWIHHHGLIQAEGGMVQITAASASDLIDRVIFHEGTTDVSSHSFVQVDGKTFIQKSSIAITTAGTQGYIDVTGHVDASSASSDIDSLDIDSSNLDSSNFDSSDKSIQITGEAVFLRDQARVLSNGESGGDIRVIANYLAVEDGVELEARGQAGDGGFVELSGHIDLDIRGNVNTSSIEGKTGELLIDPRNITINTAATTGMTSSISGETVFSPTGNSATIRTQTIIDALVNNNVIVTTDDGGVGTQEGNLVLASDLDLDTIDGNTLTLRANNILSINADIEDKGIDAVGGNANIVLEAGQDLQMLAGTRIDAGMGTITINVTNADITLTQLESDIADTTAITINVGGSIIDNNDNNDNIILNGANAVLSMTAGSFIDHLEGKVPIYRAISTQQDVKGFSQTQAGDLQISVVESASAPLIGFTANTTNGDITVRGIAGEVTPGIRIGSAGRLIVDAGGTGANIRLEENISTGTGDVTITANDGSITMGETNQITSTSGSVSMSSRLTQTIGLISTGATDVDAIRLEVTGGEDILDAHDALSDTVNLSAPNGGFELVNVDNFASLETAIARFSSRNLNVSQIVLNETDDLIIDQLAGSSTAMTLVAGGTVEVDTIDTAGTISIQANRIAEFYVNAADETAKQNVASITASGIILRATTSIGDVTDTSLSAADYLDVDTANLRVELLGEVTADNANEIAVQQVSSEATGPLIVSEIITPEEAGSAKVFLASRNNSLDLSTTTITLDSTDVLGVSVQKVLNTNPVEVLLPAVATVQSWTLAGLALVAEAVGTRIATNEIAGSTLLSSLTTSADQLYWASNAAQTIIFSGNDIDLETTNGSISVVASGALDIEDLNGDGNSLETASGNISVVSNGLLQLSGDISATDTVNNSLREGLIDISTNTGNIIIGNNDVDIRSINTLDSDADGGLGSSPTDQVAIRIAQNNISGTASITVGSETTSVNMLAHGGDIYIASGARAASRDPDERTLIVNENTVITAYNQLLDPIVNAVVENEVDKPELTAANASITTREGRQILLTSVNIAGFNLEDGVESSAEDAIEDLERGQTTPTESVDSALDDDGDNQTRMTVMLDTVIPGCESGESMDNSSQCLKKQGFKEFLRSLVIGRGFPEKYKGLP